MALYHDIAARLTPHLDNGVYLPGVSEESSTPMTGTG